MGSEMAPKKKASRFPIKLPPWHHKRLIKWARCKGTFKTRLAQNILQARIEVNADQIEEMFKELAKDLGKQPDELEAEVLADAGFSPGDIEIEAETEED